MNFDPSAIHPLAFAPGVGCNTTDEEIKRQVEFNIRRGFPQLQPYAPNSTPAILVCGGPSLRSSERDIVNASWRGGKVVAVNGAYAWCVERNIRPGAMVMLDAREFNARFVETPVLDCKYLLASQCHPRAFDLCGDRDTYIWHACTGGEGELDLLNRYYFERTYPVTLGTTVAIRAISLLRMLGFQWIEVFGLDSCWLDDGHHAYEQVENDRDERLTVWLRPQGADGSFRDDLAQSFVCSPWHLKQATDFQELVAERGDSFQLNVHGPGLIATMIRTGASLAT